MIMGHEMAHALREHARERMGKSAATSIGASVLSQLFGLGDLGQTVASYGVQLLNLRFGREDESEADLWFDAQHCSQGRPSKRQPVSVLRL